MDTVTTASITTGENPEDAAETPPEARRPRHRRRTAPRVEPGRLAAYREFITAHALLIEEIERLMTVAGVIPLKWYDVLIELYEAPERRLRQRELACAVVLSKSNLSRLLDRLEAAGLIAREPCETDRRGAYAALTEAGLAAMRVAWPVYARAIEAHFARHLSDADAATLVAVCDRVIAALHAPIPPEEGQG